MNKGGTELGAFLLFFSVTQMELEWKGLTKSFVQSNQETEVLLCFDEFAPHALVFTAISLVVVSPLQLSPLTCCFDTAQNDALFQSPAITAKIFLCGIRSQ